ncbi:MAG: hypothetical protein KKC55_17090 [Gammaproteobacteria bacterium]|nr:hypothetical protein [Gammaproteobacteria bacterium]
MNADDYAIVIGIRRYPTLGTPYPPGNPHDLQGPERDARAVNDWLADEAGGGVPEANRLMVTSDMYPDPFPTELVAGQERVAARPNVDELSGCFGWLIELYTSANKLRLGRRLYVYFAGHGFGVADCDGGVYAANASPGIRHHFYVQNWFNWLYHNAYFDEFVLWMDSCSDPILINGMPNTAPLADRQVEGFSQGRRFVVYAARHPLRSVERRMPDGEIRGVFTYALLEGLRGAASLDPVTGRVTARTLRDYLNGSLAAFQPQQDRDNPDIGSEPSFGVEDHIEFGMPALKSFALILRFHHRHVGQKAVILGGDLAPVDSVVVGAEPWTVKLPSGIFKLEVAPDTKIFIEMNGNGADDIFVE